MSTVLDLVNTALDAPDSFHQLDGYDVHQAFRLGAAKHVELNPSCTKLVRTNADTVPASLAAGMNA